MQEENRSEKIITFHTIDSKVTFRFSKATGFRRCSSSPSATVPTSQSHEQDVSVYDGPPPWQCSVCQHQHCYLPDHRQYMTIFQPAQPVDPDKDVDYPYMDDGTGSPMELCASFVDPFGQFPFRMSLEMQEAYRDFYVPWTTTNPGLLEYHLYPLSRFGLAMASAQHDPACFMALLAVATIQSSLARSRKASDLGLRLQRAAIRLQAAACQQDGPIDARILSAMCILFNELAMRSLSQVAPLFRSVTSLVSQRGGIQNLGMNGILAGDLLITDHGMALLNYTPPLLKLPYRVVDVPDMIESDLGRAFLKLPISHGVLTVIRDFACLLNKNNRACQGLGTFAESDYFVYLCELAEQQLAELNAAYKDTNTLEALLISAIIMIDLSVLRFPGKIQGTVMVMECRFWKSYDNMRAHSDLANDHDLDIWLAFTGTLTSVHRPSLYEDKAVNILRDMVQHSKLSRDFCDLKPILDQYIWCEPAQSVSCRALLDRAVAAIPHSRT